MRTASRCPSRSPSVPSARDSSVFTPRISSEPMSITGGLTEVRPATEWGAPALHTTKRHRGSPGRRRLGAGSLGQSANWRRPRWATPRGQPGLRFGRSSDPKGSCIEIAARVTPWALASGGAASGGMAAVCLAWTWRVLGVSLARAWRAPGVYIPIRWRGGCDRGRGGKIDKQFAEHSKTLIDFSRAPYY